MSRGAKGSKPGDGKDAARPAREDVLRFVADNPERATKRDIAKAFKLKGQDRIWLKQLLREFEAEGLLAKQGKKLSRPGALPPVAVLDIFGRDADGGLLARPSESREEDGESVVISVGQARGGKATTAGVGDRVLARLFMRERPDGPAYTARVMKVFDKRRDA
ncbi:MAG: ribonuclease R, partial [Nitratireductor sp.]